MREFVSFQHIIMQTATNALHNQDNRNVRDIAQHEPQHNKHKTPDPGRSHLTELSLCQ